MEDSISNILKELNVFLVNTLFKQNKKGLEYYLNKRLKNTTRSIFLALGILI